MTTSLANLAAGRCARVHSFSPGAECALNLMELGLVPGARLTVVRKAPLGGPLQVDVTGAHLALRRNVAATVIVEPLAP